MNQLLKSSIAVIATTLALALTTANAMASGQITKPIERHNMKNNAEVYVDLGKMYVNQIKVEMHDHDENYKFDLYVRDQNGNETKLDTYHDVSTNNSNPICEGTINDYGNHEHLTGSCYEKQTVVINREITAIRFYIYGDDQNDGNVHIRNMFIDGGAVQGVTNDFCNEDSKFPQVFPDVAMNNVYYEHVQELECHNVIHGYSDGTFRLYAPITRGEMAKMISNGMRMEESKACGSFRDVPTSSKFYNYISTLKCRGVINGYSDGTFRPDQYVTRAEAMKFIVNGARIRTNNPNFLATSNSFNMLSDVYAYDPAYQYIIAGQNANAYQDLRNNQFRPNNMITRGEFALYMNIVRREIDKTVIDYGTSANTYQNSYSNTNTNNVYQNTYTNSNTTSTNNNTYMNNNYSYMGGNYDSGYVY